MFWILCQVAVLKMLGSQVFLWTFDTQQKLHFFAVSCLLMEREHNIYLPNTLTIYVCVQFRLTICQLRMFEACKL